VIKRDCAIYVVKLVHTALEPEYPHCTVSFSPGTWDDTSRVFSFGNRRFSPKIRKPKLRSSNKSLYMHGLSSYLKRQNFIFCVVACVCQVTRVRRIREKVGCRFDVAILAFLFSDVLKAEKCPKFHHTLSS